MDTESRAERTAWKAERQAAKQRLTEQRRLARGQQAAEQREAEQRERQALAARAYDNHLRVRAWARPWVDTACPRTAAEQRMAAGLAPLWDASAEIITNLRSWSEPVTEVRPADYDPAPQELVLRLKNTVATLRRHAGADLFVQESPLLGGFGIDWHRECYNEDTVRFFKALVGLQDGGVLAPCRAPGPRRLVWEIGGGWGGFAFQFKTVSPNVTYLITGMPELLLLSAAYLMTAFPEARCRLYDAAASADFFSGWEEVDFAFAPDHVVADLRMPEIYATLDVMALHAMSESAVALHIQRAFDSGSRYFFSQVCGPCFPEPLPRVWRAIERLFWLHEIPPPLDIAAFYVDDFYKAPVIDDYAQAVGWRRLHVG